MIEAISSYSQHSLIGLIVEGVTALTLSVNRVAIIILAELAISGILLNRYPNLFPLGFVIGFVFDIKVRETIGKVKTVFTVQKTSLEKFLFYVGGGLLTLLTMPASLITMTLYFSAEWGARLCKYSHDRQRLQNHDQYQQREATPILQPQFPHYNGA